MRLRRRQAKRGTAVNSQSNRKRLLTSTIIGGAMAAMTVPALAQDAGSNTAQTVREVVVTGSRIPRPNTTAVSPVQTVGQQEFKLEGTVGAETLLNNLPAVSPSSTQSQNGGGIGEGLATVDLRGFGPTRTLVLIDGRRMPPGDAQEPVATRWTSSPAARLRSTVRTPSPAS
jgi:iron complex outermembrane receptor protein